VSLSGEVLPPEGDPEDCGRRLRSDARKNRARLLEAAEAVFAEKGIAVPIDDVARRAGLGVGTLYRHFPTKEALFAAVVVTRLEQLRDESRCLLEDPDPGAALFVFATHLGEQAAAKHDLADALAAAGIDVKADMADVMDEMNANVQGLITRAQQCGAIRDDLTAQELFGLVMGSCIAAHHQGLDAEAQQRLIGVVFDGMRQLPG
jgi:AcrR family transcriptional regulator